MPPVNITRPLHITKQLRVPTRAVPFVLFVYCTRTTFFSFLGSPVLAIYGRHPRGTHKRDRHIQHTTVLLPFLVPPTSTVTRMPRHPHNTPLKSRLPFAASFLGPTARLSYLVLPSLTGTSTHRRPRSRRNPRQNRCPQLRCS